VLPTGQVKTVDQDATAPGNPGNKGGPAETVLPPGQAKALGQDAASGSPGKGGPTETVLPTGQVKTVDQDAAAPGSPGKGGPTKAVLPHDPGSALSDRAPSAAPDAPLTFTMKFDMTPPIPPQPAEPHAPGLDVLFTALGDASLTALHPAPFGKSALPMPELLPTDHVPVEILPPLPHRDLLFH
jgi:hypothetical protein